MARRTTDDKHENREVAKNRVRLQDPSETNYSADGGARYEYLENKRAAERERHARGER